MADRRVRRVLDASEQRGREEPWDPERLLRRMGRTAMAEDPEDESSASGPTLSLWDVRQLSLRQRAAVLLVYWGDCSIKDAASAMGTTPKVIQDLLRRAREELREAAADAAAVSARRRL